MYIDLGGVMHFDLCVGDVMYIDFSGVMYFDLCGPSSLPPSSLPQPSSNNTGGDIGDGGGVGGQFDDAEGDDTYYYNV